MTHNTIYKFFMIVKKEIMIQQVVDWIKTKPSKEVIRENNDLWHKTQVWQPLQTHCPGK
jgi:hypothetical protein